jgi:serine protease AprX
MNFTDFHLAAALVAPGGGREGRQIPPSRLNAQRAAFHAILIIGLLAGLVPTFAMGAVQTAPRLQPALVLVAAQSPDQTISVIVQKSVRNASVEGLVARLGGRVTQDLSLINAFAAQMTAKAVLELGRAAGVKWVSLDAPVRIADGPDGSLSAANLVSVYDSVVGADRLWAEGYQGSSVTVAVVDSGWTGHPDFRALPSGGNMRLLTRVGFNGNETNLDDHSGHGDFVAGIIGGNGARSQGQYIGMAPKVNLVSVKVSAQDGQGTISGLVAGLQWIYNNRSLYNIRVVNISINSSVPESYRTSALDAAVEILWFNGIVVVVSSGNNGDVNGVVYPPANDPFAITVGATDDRGTASLQDDVVSNYSAAGVTEDGIVKPDLVAPGTNLVAPLSSGGADLSKAHQQNQVLGTSYFRMSGTSVAAPVVAGAVALLLQHQPGLTPDQVKYRLLATANINWPGYSQARAGAGYLDAYAALHTTTTGSANTDQYVSNLLTTGPNGLSSSSVSWSSVSWSSVSWSSVSWSSVSWSSVSWSSVSWSSDYWGP